MKKEEITENFDPKIVVFACTWSGYSSADCAGNDKIQYSPNLNIIKIACSGRVSPGHLLKAFELGADGILFIGCNPGNCHYISGNKNAEMNVKRTKELLKLLGLEEKRLRLEWLPDSEGEQFAEIVNDFVQQVHNLGRNPLAAERNDK